MTKSVQIFLIIISFVFLTAWSFSQTKITRPDDYKPIPANMSKQYKQEMEQIIDKEYPHVISKVDEYVADTKVFHDKIQKTGYNFNDYINMTLTMEVCIPAADLDLYANLMKVTQEKYLGVKYEPIGTDTPNPIFDFLQPYFEDNQVNTHKLIKIINYEKKNIRIAEKYIKDIEKLKPNND